MRTTISVLALWVGFLLQSTVFQIPPFYVVKPNFVLVILVLIALTRGSKHALILGLVIGLLQDVDYGSFLGLYAFAYGVIGYFSAAAFLQFLHRNIAITFLITMAFTFIYEWMTYGLTRLFDVTSFGWSTVLSTSLQDMIVNGVLLLLLYPILTRWFSGSSKRKYKTSVSEN
jgi:rod shape-determining protein MreD